jgi:predicted nucleotidyltransferase
MDTGTILSDQPAVLLRRYKQALLEAGYMLDKLILFGSYAKGEAHHDSDLDVCVVFKDYKNTWDEEMKLVRIAHKIDDMIEVHAMTPRDLADPYSTMAQEIREYGVVV